MASRALAVPSLFFFFFFTGLRPARAGRAATRPRSTRGPPGPCPGRGHSASAWRAWSRASATSALATAVVMRSIFRQELVAWPASRGAAGAVVVEIALDAPQLGWPRHREPLLSRPRRSRRLGSGAASLRHARSPFRAMEGHQATVTTAARRRAGTAPASVPAMSASTLRDGEASQLTPAVGCRRRSLDRQVAAEARRGSESRPMAAAHRATTTTNSRMASGKATGLVDHVAPAVEVHEDGQVRSRGPLPYGGWVRVERSRIGPRRQSRWKRDGQPGDPDADAPNHHEAEHRDHQDGRADRDEGSRPRNERNRLHPRTRRSPRRGRPTSPGWTGRGGSPPPSLAPGPPPGSRRGRSGSGGRPPAAGRSAGSAWPSARATRAMKKEGFSAWWDAASGQRLLHVSGTRQLPGCACRSRRT